MLTIASRLDVMNRLGRAMADPTRSRILMTLLDGPSYPAVLSRELELTFVSLEARVSNAAARSLYAQKGFIDAGIRPGYYEKPREDAVIMTLYLSKEGISDDNISS